MSPPINSLKLKEVQMNKQAKGIAGAFAALLAALMYLIFGAISAGTGQKKTGK